MIDNSQGVVNIIPVGGGNANPPFFEGTQFYYFCAEPLVYQLTPNEPLTTCEDDGFFTQDIPPPSCAQICMKSKSTVYIVNPKFNANQFTNHLRKRRRSSKKKTSNFLRVFS